MDRALLQGLAMPLLVEWQAETDPSRKAALERSVRSVTEAATEMAVAGYRAAMLELRTTHPS
jgi:hypothetical protein